MRKGFKKVDNSDEYQPGIHNPGNTRLSQLQVNSKLARNSGGILAGILALWITGVDLWKLKTSITCGTSAWSPLIITPTPVFDPEEIWANTGVIPEGMPSKLGVAWVSCDQNHLASLLACGLGRRGGLSSSHPKRQFLSSWVHAAQGASEQPIRMFYPQSVQWSQVGRVGHRTLRAKKEKGH